MVGSGGREGVHGHEGVGLLIAVEGRDPVGQGLGVREVGVAAHDAQRPLVGGQHLQGWQGAQAGWKQAQGRCGTPSGR